MPNYILDFDFNLQNFALNFCSFKRLIIVNYNKCCCCCTHGELRVL